MSQATYGLVLAIFLIFGTFTLYVRFVPYRQEKRKHQRFRLFKVRDDWVYLIPHGKIRTDDPFFLWFYEVINFFIRETDKLSLRTMVTAISKAQQRQLDPATQEQLDFVSKQLEKQPPEVALVIQEFFHAVGEILVENSFTLRLILAVQKTKLMRFLGSFVFVIKQILSFRQWQAYRHAQRYTQAATTIGILMVSFATSSMQHPTAVNQ